MVPKEWVDKMSNGRSMAELKSLMGITDKKGIENMSNEQWDMMYDNGQISLEKYSPFSEQIKTPPYRYEWILKKVNDLKGNSLDVGCNNGALAYLLNQKGFVAHGMDVGDQLLEQCEKNVPEGKFVKGHADELIPFSDDFFHVVTALEVLEHVKDPAKMIEEMYRVLAPKGKLLITVPVNKAYDNPRHLRYFSFYSLGELFESITDEFKICRIYKSNDKEERQLFALEVTK